MMKKSLLLLGVMFLAVVASFLVVDRAEAVNLFDGVCKSYMTASGSAACGENGKDNIAGPNGILRNATTLIALVSGIIAVIIILIAGFNYVTAAGDASKVETAKKTIIFTVVGLVIIVVAQSLILFVMSRI